MSSQDGQNLLLITFDQLRGDWFDSDRNPILLPNVEKVSMGALVAKRCYTPSTHCIPSRFSWLTGKTAGENKITKNMDINAKTETPSIFRRLKEEGYLTSIVGKTHWTSHRKKCDLRENVGLMNELGFTHCTEIAGPRALMHVECDITDDWKKEGWLNAYRTDLTWRYKTRINNSWLVKETCLPINLYPDIWITKKGKQILEGLPKHSRWFLWISFVGPHEPFDTPFPWKGQNVKNQLPKAIKKQPWVNDIDRESPLGKMFEKWRDRISEKEIEDLRADYADKLGMLDELLGSIIETLETREDYNKTNVCITSDHGDMLGDYGMLYKSTLLEQAIKVPMIVKTANRETKTINNDPVTSTDIIKYLVQKTGSRETITSNGLDSLASSKGQAIVEFGDEKAYISKERKIVYDTKGNEVWESSFAEGLEKIHYI